MVQSYVRSSKNCPTTNPEAQTSMILWSNKGYTVALLHATFSLLLLVCCVTISVATVASATAIDGDNTLNCHRRQYTYKVTETDDEGRTCWDYVKVISCWGRCDSNEIADWKFPYKRSHHPVCLHESTKENTVTLQNCDAGVKPGTERYTFTEASVCSCSVCKSSEASCEGLRYRGARRAPSDTSGVAGREKRNNFSSGYRKELEEKSNRVSNRDLMDRNGIENPDYYLISEDVPVRAFGQGVLSSEVDPFSGSLTDVKRRDSSQQSSPFKRNNQSYYYSTADKIFNGNFKNLDGNYKRFEFPQSYSNEWDVESGRENNGFQNGYTADHLPNTEQSRDTGLGFNKNTDLRLYQDNMMRPMIDVKKRKMF